MKRRDETIQRLALQVFELTKRTWVRSQREKLRGGYDLSESEFLALDALDRAGTLSVGQLRGHVGVLPAQMSRVIKALEQRYDEKLVVCSINPRDKRKIDVTITPRGRRAVGAYRDSKILMTVRAMESLADEDLRALVRILARMGRTLEGREPE